jgi:uncharacterized protein
MNVVGRFAEIEIMQNLIDDDASNFLAMYGRRRIGKTYLIREFYKPHMVFEASGIHEKDINQQLENFWLSLFEVEKKKRPKPESWLIAFQYLKEYISTKRSKTKKVIFLDEIAWFETPKSGFLTALDKFWNQFCSKRNDIILVVCGSAASWIIQKIINNKGGLHNRLTCQIQLLPFDITETKLFLQSKNIHLVNRDLIKLYMIVGGIPYYLNFYQKGKSVDQVIEQLFFTEKAKLKNEFANLYASLFKNSEYHIKVVQALATKNKGLTRTEILQATKLKSGGGFTNILQELILCGFVKELPPIGNKKEDALYRLMDEFTLFYYKFIHNKKNKTNWLQFTATQEYKIWQGFSFENYIFKHLHIVKKELGIGGIISHEYAWLLKGNRKEKGTQIDLIIDRADNCANIIEAKFYNTEIVLKKDTLETILNKKNIFIEKSKTKKNVFITMITINGVKENEYYLEGVTNQINMAEVF